MKNILFLCTGNSCRSQMAEGLVNHYRKNDYKAYSAGTKPSYVHPLAIQVMRELGLDISTYRSKHLDEFRNMQFDLVITLCDSANQECPHFPGAKKTINKNFPDPAVLIGSQEAVLKGFRGVRDAIKTFILTL